MRKGVLFSNVLVVLSITLIVIFFGILIFNLFNLNKINLSPENNGSCTYGVISVENNTFRLTNGDNRFVCVNDKWYDWANVRDEKYWGFSIPAELCNDYGSFFPGMFGSYNRTSNGLKRWLPGSSLNYFCESGKYCDTNKICTPCVENKECHPEIGRASCRERV